MASGVYDQWGDIHWQPANPQNWVTYSEVAWDIPRGTAIMEGRRYSPGKGWESVFGPTDVKDFPGRKLVFAVIDEREIQNIIMTYVTEEEIQRLATEVAKIKRSDEPWGDALRRYRASQ